MGNYLTILTHFGIFTIFVSNNDNSTNKRFSIFFSVKTKKDLGEALVSVIVD